MCRHVFCTRETLCSFPGGFAEATCKAKQQCRRTCWKCLIICWTNIIIQAAAGQGGWLCVCIPERTGACSTFPQEGHRYEQVSYVQSSRGRDADCACFNLGISMAVRRPGLWWSPSSKVTMRLWPPSPKPGEASSLVHYRDLITEPSPTSWLAHQRGCGLAQLGEAILSSSRQISCHYIAVHRGACFVFYGNCSHLRQAHQNRSLTISFFCAVMIKCLAGLHYFPSRRRHGEVRSDKNTGQSCSAGVLTSRTTITIMSSCVRRAFWSNVHSKHFRFEEELIMVPERIYSYSHFHRSLLNFFQVL